MRIIPLAAATAVLVAASGGAALACETVDPCAGGAAASVYVFEPAPALRGHRVTHRRHVVRNVQRRRVARHGVRHFRMRPPLYPPVLAMAPPPPPPPRTVYLAAPGPTPAYAASRYGGAQAGYGEVRRFRGYIPPYTPAFGRVVQGGRPYTGPGTAYMVEQRGPCADRCAPAAYGAAYGYEEEEGRPVNVAGNFFSDGLTGGTGYGVDGGYVGGGGGGGFVDSGFGFSAANAFGRSFAGASASAHAHASATAVAFSYGGKGHMGGGKKGGCGGCGGGHGKH